MDARHQPNSFRHSRHRHVSVSVCPSWTQTARILSQNRAIYAIGHADTTCVWRVRSCVRATLPMRKLPPSSLHSWLKLTDFKSELLISFNHECKDLGGNFLMDRGGCTRTSGKESIHVMRVRLVHLTCHQAMVSVSIMSNTASVFGFAWCICSSAP
jgi:hypothetical protein